MSLSLRYINQVDPYLKSEMLYFGKWLRKNYDFPELLEVRLINKDVVLDSDGTECALRWWKSGGSVKVELAVSSFNENLKNEGPEVAFPTVIAAIGRGLYYYYQKINDRKSSEKRAESWGDKVMNAFISKTTPPYP